MCSIFTSLILIAKIRVLIVIDLIIFCMIFDFFCKVFFILFDFVCIFNSSLFSRIMFQIFFACNFFIIFLIIMFLKISRSSSLMIRTMSSRVCFVIFELIALIFRMISESAIRFFANKTLFRIKLNAKAITIEIFTKTDVIVSTIK